jgi:hypothetical protein
MSFIFRYQLRKTSYGKVVWSTLGVLVFLAAAISNFVGAAHSSAIQSGVRVPAYVESVTATQSDSFKLLVRYRFEGRTWQEHVNYKSSSRHLPSTLEVAFASTSPSVIEVLGQPTRTSDTGWILLLISLLFGVFLTLQGRLIWNGSRSRRLRRRR